MIHLIYSEQFLDHDTGRPHPESFRRLVSITDALKDVPWKTQLQWHEPTSITERDPLPWILRLHTAAYLANLKAMAEAGGDRWDQDTVISPRSYEVALLAVNACLDGVDQVLATEEMGETGEIAFALIRPPGHHAVRDNAMGFCLLGNGAIAAEYALTQEKIKRVAILDWDVHHGNGTEALVEDNPDILYCSLHQDPAYPGTGPARFTGRQNNILNIPLAPSQDGFAYRTAFEQKILPRLQDFQPDFLIVSAGYDATAQDPLAGMNLDPADYKTFSEYCQTLNCPILFVLEGGYHLKALAESVIATLEPFVNFP